VSVRGSYIYPYITLHDALTTLIRVTPVSGITVEAASIFLAKIMIGIQFCVVSEDLELNLADVSRRLL
jgi:hypothetical protein